MKLHIDLNFGNNVYEIHNDMRTMDCYQMQRSAISGTILNKIVAEGRTRFVYFLLDINEAKDLKRKIYIGQTEDLPSRINSHKQTKLWWNTMVVFSRRGLMIDDIKALEKVLIERYENSDMYTMMNGTGSNANVYDYHAPMADYITNIMEFLTYGDAPSVITPTAVNTRVVQSQPVGTHIQQVQRQKKPPFKFSMVGINAGESIVFKNNKKITCIVSNDDKNVLYEGKSYSLSSLAMKLLNTNVSKQGPLFFEYKGETLKDLRDKADGVNVINVPKTNNWIISCNKAFYDLDKALNEMTIIDFKQNANIEAGSRIFIYSSGDEKTLVYETEAIIVNKPEQTIDDSKYIKDKNGYSDSNRYMELKLIKKFDNPISLNEMKTHGLTSTLQGPCRVTVELQDYIDNTI